MADTKSATLLNAILAGASATYKERIPLATRTNLAEVGTAILEYDVTRNEFVNTLVNKIALSVMKNKMYENPLKEFKRGMLPAGETIEEIFVELVKAFSYDAATAESNVFARALPDVRSLFHTVNRADVYKTTTQYDALVKAFKSDDGVMQLVNAIVSSLYTSDELDEFEIMKGAIQRFGVEGKFWPVVITAPTNEATAKAALTQIKAVSNNLTFMSDAYNVAGVKNHSQKADQLFLISTAFDALLDVEVMASAFNMDKVEFAGRRILLDNFGGLPNVVAAIVDRDWFMNYDKLIAVDQIWNPEGRYFNHFLHHQGVYSVSPFENAVVFQTAAPTITAITVTPDTATVSATEGGTIQCYVEVSTGTNNAPIHCTWESDTEGVTVNSQGFVTVPKNHGNDTVTITCTSKFNTSVSDDLVITVGTGGQ